MPDQVRCPACHSAHVARLRRRLFDRFLSFLSLYPFKCESCNRRFRARWSEPPDTPRSGSRP